MARDYKHRVQGSAYGRNRARKRKAANLPWRWLMVAVLIVAFVVFLNMIRTMVAELVTGKSGAVVSQTDQTVKQTLPLDSNKLSGDKPITVTPEKSKEEAELIQPEEPQYDFYTILPQAETVIPDYEIQSRVREELVGKAKATKYVMQAGSFREETEAERHKAKLALLGIESWIEKAKVGSVIWHRVKIGPYDNPSSVSTIKDLLQKNGIGVIVTEQGK